MLRLNLSYLFGSFNVDHVLQESQLPDDLNDKTVLISGSKCKTITDGGAQQLIRLLIERNPRDIIATQMSDQGRMAFTNAVLDLMPTLDFAYLDLTDIPPEFLD